MSTLPTDFVTENAGRRVVGVSPRQYFSVTSFPSLSMTRQEEPRFWVSVMTLSSFFGSKPAWAGLTFVHANSGFWVGSLFALGAVWVEHAARTTAQDRSAQTFFHSPDLMCTTSIFTGCLETRHIEIEEAAPLKARRPRTHWRRIGDSNP